MFARQEPKKIYLPADPRVRCTMQRAMWWFDEARIEPPKDYKLGTLCEYFGIAVSETHEALEQHFFLCPRDIVSNARPRKKSSTPWR